MSRLSSFESKVFTELRSKKYKKWSAEQAHLGIQAGFRCEYCGRDLVESVNSYYSWQRDHIVPLSKGGSSRFSNRALACRTCNFNLKGRWDPRDAAGKHASRSDLIKAVRRYVSKQRKMVERGELDFLQRLLKRPKPKS